MVGWLQDRQNKIIVMSIWLSVDHDLSISTLTWRQGHLRSTSNVKFGCLGASALMPWWQKVEGQFCISRAAHPFSRSADNVQPRWGMVGLNYAPINCKGPGYPPPPPPPARFDRFILPSGGGGGVTMRLVTGLGHIDRRQVYTLWSSHAPDSMDQVVKIYRTIPGPARWGWF